ncbi:MAG: hypothetical protein U0414_23640 [Polyangiaceae bacterium]
MISTASASASARASLARPPACSGTCAPGTRCELTKDGPACVACAPGSLPTCRDGRFLEACTDEGKRETVTDCETLHRRCDQGRCAARVCAPNALECFDADVYRCNADGTARTLVTACVITGADGSLDASRGLCQGVNGVPACSKACNLPDHTIVAMRDCDTCSWDGIPFCTEEYDGNRGCTDWFCLPGGAMGFGVVSMPCVRDTEGLIVPGSKKTSACEGTGPIGSRTITYDTCKGGQPVAATRVEPCMR